MRPEPLHTREISPALIDNEQITLQAPLIGTNDFIDRFARNDQMQHYNLTHTVGTTTSRYSTLHGAADYQHSQFDVLTIPGPHFTSQELVQTELSTLHILNHLGTDTHTHILIPFQASRSTRQHQECNLLHPKVLDFLCPTYWARHHAHIQPTSSRAIEDTSLAVKTRT